MRYTLGLLFILTLFWGVNSTNDSYFLLFLGVLSVLFVLFISNKMKLIDRETIPLHLYLRVWPFYAWLIKEIALGSFYVLKLILLPNKKASPTVVKINIDFEDPLSEVIFANSISLVPGTLSLELKKGEILVHALTQELADELVNGELARRIKRLEN